MTSYTLRLMTTSGNLVRETKVPAAELVNALHAEGLSGREIRDGADRACQMNLTADGRSDDHAGQYLTWTADEQCTARQAVPGTVVYLVVTEGVAQGANPLATREHQVVVGEWRPSKALGLGYADLYDNTGRFRITAAADDLLHVVPAHQRRRPNPAAHLMA